MQLNPADGSVGSQIPLTDTGCLWGRYGPQGLAHDGTALWVACDQTWPTNWPIELWPWYEGNLVRIDTATGDPLKELQAPGSFNIPGNRVEGLAWDGTHLWLATSNDREIFKIDPSSGDVVDTVPSASSGTEGLAYGGGYLWEGGSDAEIYKIDPTTGQVVLSFTGPGLDVHGLAWDAGYLWAASSVTELIYKMDVHLDIDINIDIKPGNKRNVINPREKGGVWVAVLSSTDFAFPFDPSSQIDIPTVKFGPEGALADGYRIKDINKDRVSDLLLHFRVRETGIACGDTEASLSATAFEGWTVTSTDSIRTVGCFKHPIPPTAMPNPDNGHWYKRYDRSMTWHDAMAFCESNHGYLATITSASENAFVYTNLVANAPTGEVWLGATDEDTEGVWEWITGEPWSYVNWYKGDSPWDQEPNNQDWVGENYLTIYSLLDIDGRAGFWNDREPNYHGQPISLICEWGSEKLPKHLKNHPKSKGKKRCKKR